MKKYLTPSIEINKFDVEDIITTSGTTVVPGSLTTDTTKLSAAGQSLYTESGKSGADAVAEFQW